MTEFQRFLIVACARSCERALWLADRFDRAGRFSDAGDSFAVAEIEAEIALSIATSQPLARVVS